jgi:V8-like Glu-specific endopeptidase
VGKLTVPGHRLVEGDRLHLQEDCSATLIAPRIILSAWHCLENYRDLSRDILFALPNHSPPLTLRANRLADGGGMMADWALLRLERPLRDVRPLSVSADSPARLQGKLSVAGYSGDDHLGDSGERLTWQAACNITGNEHYRVATDCLAFKGASGGAAYKDGKIIGVISAGDSVGITYFAPSARFISAVRLHAH